MGKSALKVRVKGRRAMRCPRFKGGGAMRCARFNGGGAVMRPRT